MPHATRASHVAATASDLAGSVADGLRTRSGPQIATASTVWVARSSHQINAASLRETIANPDMRTTSNQAWKSTAMNTLARLFTKIQVVSTESGTMASMNGTGTRSTGSDRTTGRCHRAQITPRMMLAVSA